MNNTDIAGESIEDNEKAVGRGGRDNDEDGTRMGSTDGQAGNRQINIQHVEHCARAHRTAIAWK